MHICGLCLLSACLDCNAGKNISWSRCKHAAYVPEQQSIQIRLIEKVPGWTAQLAFRLVGNLQSLKSVIDETKQNEWKYTTVVEGITEPCSHLLLISFIIYNLYVFHHPQMLHPNLLTPESHSRPLSHISSPLSLTWPLMQAVLIGLGLHGNCS